MEVLTELLMQVINILFLYNITGTTFGILLGLFIISIQQVVIIYFPIIGHFPWYGSMSFCIMLFNKQYLFTKKYEDPMIEKRLKYVREVIKESNFSKAEERMIWRKTIEIILEEITNDSISNSVNNSNDNNSVTN